MGYFDPELNNAWAWFSTNWEKWRTLNTALSDGLGYVMDNTTGPSGPHKETHWQWVRDNREELLNLYNSIK